MNSNIMSIIMMIGGLALFLHGVEQSAVAFQRGLGGRAREIMGRLTGSRFSAFGFGVMLSAVTQSSTAATAFAVGLVDLNLLPYVGSILVMMGASVGATFVTPLLSLDVIAYSPLFLGISLLLSRLRWSWARRSGPVLMGIFLVLTGTYLIKLGVTPLMKEAWMVDLVLHLTGRPLVLAAGAFFLTAMIQSTSAVLAFAIVMVSTGLIGPGTLFPFVLGAHVGSSSTVLLTSMGGRPNARRLAWFSMVYKLAGSALAALFSFLFVDSADLMTNNLGMQVAIYQIELACFNSVVLFPFLPPLAKWSQKWFSGTHSEENIGEPLFLDKGNCEFTALSLSLLSKEMTRLANYIEEMMYRIFFWNEDKKRLDSLCSGISELAEACCEYMFAIPAPSGDAKMERIFSSLSYSMVAMKDIGEMLSGRLYSLCGGGNISLILKGDCEEKFQEYLHLLTNLLESSLRGFALGDKSMAEESEVIYQRFQLCDRQLRLALTGKGSLFGERRGTLVWNFLAAGSGIARAANDLANGVRLATTDDAVTTDVSEEISGDNVYFPTR